MYRFFFLTFFLVYYNFSKCFGELDSIPIEIKYHFNFPYDTDGFGSMSIQTLVKKNKFNYFLGPKYWQYNYESFIPFGIGSNIDVHAYGLILTISKTKTPLRVFR